MDVEKKKLSETALFHMQESDVMGFPGGLGFWEGGLIA